MITILFGILIVTCGVRSEFADDYGVIQLSNTEAWSDDYNIVDPLDAEFYGMTDDDQDIVADDPLNDVEDEIEDVIEELTGYVEVIEEDDVVDDDENRRGNRRRMQRKLWRKSGRQTMRNVYRFMNRRNNGNIRDVPAKIFQGPLRRVHTNNQNNGDMGNRRQHVMTMYRKIKRKVNRRLNQKNTRSNVENICQNVSKIAMPRQAILSKLPQNVRPQYMEIFQRRKEMLVECCGIEDIVERKECFFEAYLEKFEGFCQVEAHKRRNLIVRNWNKKSECCGIEDFEEKQECNMKVSRDIRKGKWNKAGKANARKRMVKTCRNVMKPTTGTWQQRLFARMSPAETQEWRAIFIKRRQDMSICCQKSWAEKFECAEGLRLERLNRVCVGEEDLKPEPRYNERKHDALVQECCEKTDEGRLSCFTGKNKKTKGGRIDVTLEIDEEVEIELDLEDEDEVVETEISEDESINRRVARNAERRGNKRGRKNKRRNNENKQEKKAAKSDCCVAGETVRAEILSMSENVTRQICTGKLTRIENIEGLRSKKCKKIFLKCCGSTEEKREAVKQMRKEKRQNKRQKKRKIKVEIDLEGDGEAQEAMQEAEEMIDALDIMQ